MLDYASINLLVALLLRLLLMIHHLPVEDELHLQVIPPVAPDAAVDGATDDGGDDDKAGDGNNDEQPDRHRTLEMCRRDDFIKEGGAAAFPATTFDRTPVPHP